MLLAFIAKVYAADLPPPNSLKTVLDSPTDALGKIGTVANWIFATLLAVAVIFVLLAAFKYLTSGGGEGVSEAHKMLLYAAIAIAVAVLAKGIVTIAAKIAGQQKPVEFVEPV
jgi:hypothetical protein